MIQVKIKKDDNIIEYVSILRKYDKTLSIRDIKQKIENHEYVIQHNLHLEFDVCDDLNGIDRNVLFRKLIAKLMISNAILEIYDNNILITIELLDKLIKRLKEIEQETIIDIDNELGEN